MPLLLRQFLLGEIHEALPRLQTFRRALIIVSRRSGRPCLEILSPSQSRSQATARQRTVDSASASFSIAVSASLAASKACSKSP